MRIKVLALALVFAGCPKQDASNAQGGGGHPPASPASGPAASQPAGGGAPAGGAPAGGATGATGGAGTSTSGAAPAKGSGIKLGGDFTGAPEQQLASVLGEPSKFDGQTVKLRGEIARVCQNKGCWMELKSAQEKDPGVRVTFKDYAFFVPKDSAGKKALIEGQLAVKKLDAETAKHYESEGATVKRNESGDALEVAIVASAVELSTN